MYIAIKQTAFLDTAAISELVHTEEYQLEIWTFNSFLYFLWKDTFFKSWYIAF